MSINLKKDAISKSYKIYSIEQKNREVINEIFNKLQAQEKLHYTTQSTLYSYSVFVI